MRGRAVVLVLCWIHSADPRWSCVVQAGRGLRSSGIWSVGVEPFALEPSTREFHFLYFYSFHPAFSFSFDFFLLILFDDFSQRSSGEILIFGHGFFRCRFFFFSAGTDDFVLWRYPTGFGYFFFFSVPRLPSRYPFFFSDPFLSKLRCDFPFFRFSFSSSSFHRMALFFIFVFAHRRIHSFLVPGLMSLCLYTYVSIARTKTRYMQDITLH